MKRLYFMSICFLCLVTLASCAQSKKDANSAVNLEDNDSKLPEKTEVAKTTVFQESNGIVVFEAESVPLSKGWSLETKHKGFSGRGYITWTDSTMVEKDNQGLLAYKINISKSGNYTLRILNFHDCEDFTECNDVYVKMDDGEWQKNFNHNVNSWDWTSQQDINHVFSDAQFSLEKGVHTLFLGGRSQYFSIDKIALYQSNIKHEDYKKAENSQIATSINQ